jgi:tyrosyl-tRNA synthetase
MSKSYGNYVGLTDEPADMFGKVMSIPDELMVKYYRLCTAVPVSEIDEIESRLASGDEHPNAAKRRLAREIVALYHSPEAAAEAEAAFDRVFKEHGVPEDVAEHVLDVSDPVHLPALLSAIGLVASNAEGRRMIDQGGVRVGGTAVPAGQYDLPLAKIDGAVLQVGKRRFARVHARREGV